MAPQRCPYSSPQFSSVTQSCLALCDPVNCSMPDLPVHHHLLEFTQTHAHWVGDAIQPSHPLSSPSPSALNLSQHQRLFKWVSSSNQVTKVLEFQLEDQFFQWTPRTDLLWDGLVGSPCSPRDSQESSPTPQFKSINSSVLSFLYSPSIYSSSPRPPEYVNFGIKNMYRCDLFSDCEMGSITWILQVRPMSLSSSFQEGGWKLRSRYWVDVMREAGVRVMWGGSHEQRNVQGYGKCKETNFPWSF